MKTRKMNKLPSRPQEKVLAGLFTLTFMLCALVFSPGQVSASTNEFDYSSQTLRVGVWIDGLDDGDVLDKGEKMAVGFQTNEDAYAVVYRINTEGLVTVLWPRSRMDDGFVFGGHEYLLPVTGARRLVASSSSGEGFVEAIISRYPFDLRDLALDFHHEFEAEKMEFFVVGDPFLAMNEVNFAITGMEDSGDFVVTNYLSYYVHEEVEHPRYLCGQCHTDDDLAMNPYDDQCTIDISYDYGWENDWYVEYGYYPIYHNPVYVYIDPWTYRPWINFWYEPYYRCTYYPGYQWRYAAYTWCDSPYYGTHGGRVKTGRGLYQPPVLKDGSRSPRQKTRDYGRVSDRIAQRGPTSREVDNMRQKQPAVRSDRDGARGGQSIRPDDRSTVVRGEKPMVRPRPTIDKPVRGSSRGGLQIKNVEGRRPRSDSPTQVGSRQDRDAVRTMPVSGPGRGYPANRSGLPSSGNSTIGGRSLPGSNGSSSVKPSSRADGGRRIKPVEPRKKGTRIWNSGSSNPNNNRNSGRSVEPRRNSGSGRSSGSTVKPRNNTGRSGSKSGSSSQVKPRSGSSGSKSRSSGSKVRSGSSSGSKSSSGKSSGSRSSGGSSGKSRSGGGSSKSSRGGGSSGRR